jgi:hypothetical protein
MTKIICAVSGTEDEDIKDVDFLQELLDGNVSFYESVQDMLDDGDHSEEKVFIMETSDLGVVKNNPKFISLKVEPKKKVAKK